MRLRQAGAVALILAVLVSASTTAIPPTPTPPVTAPFRSIDIPTPDPVILDFVGEPSRSFSTRPSAPDPKAKVIIEQPPTRILGRTVVGLASWYCRAGRSVCHSAYPDTSRTDLYAAAGPGLRAAICGIQSCTSWRGMTVRVNGVPVKLVDWCQCYWKQPHEKLIDLYWDAWIETNAQGGVTISW